MPLLSSHVDTKLDYDLTLHPSTGARCDVDSMEVTHAQSG